LTAAPLADWENFYVIAGSSAGGLTGLTFVVIALAADARRVDPIGLHAFVTPIIVHFGTVLALAAFMCVPHQTLLSISLGLGAAGIAGLIYVCVVSANIRFNLGDYLPVREDWVWNVVLPGIAYGGLLAMALNIWRQPDFTLYAVAAISMLLLFIGIHNAWDIAVWMSLKRHQHSAQEEDSKEEGKTEVPAPQNPP
jgi:hypothetical protein